MAVMKTKAKSSAPKARPDRELSGRQLALILQKIDSARSPEGKKRWRREFMRGFYGDTRADSYA